MPGMDIDGFWRLIERSARERDSLAGREEWLITALSGLDHAHIEDFEIRLQECRDRIDNAAVWAAADVVTDGCSTDGFWYFQCWLIGRGRAAFDLVAADPDALAELPSIQSLSGRDMGEWDDDEWPWWESLAYVAGAAYPGDELLFAALADRGFHRRADPLKPDWSRVGDYPRLRALFPVSGGRG